MMRKTILGIVVLLAWLDCVQAKEPICQPQQLRVLCYNIHHCEGIDRKLDLARIAGVISSVKPDLVALQEVDQGVERTQGVDQPAEIARLTSLHVVFADNIQFGGGKYGNAVLSRFPIANHKNHQLPNYDDGEQRGALEAEISIPDWSRPLIFLSTHFDHRRDDRERYASAKAINQLLADRSEEPALLAGDLNDVVESRTLQELLRNWGSVNDEPLATIPVGQPRRQIDFILYRPTQRWRVVEVKVLPEAVASDHRAIFAVLELRSDQ